MFLSPKPKGRQYGFTLMEIIVATTIFAFVGTAMTVLFNYTLKINRRTEAVRQATQGMRTFMESLVKQIRNGQIHYGLLGGVGVANGTACPVGSQGSAYYHVNGLTVMENRLRILDTDGQDVCYYLADVNNAFVGQGITSGQNLVMEKNINGVSVVQSLNPSNFNVEKLVFYIRPICDPYFTCSSYGNSYPKIQPIVSINAFFKVQLPTGEIVNIPYQTSVSSNKYDIPNQ